MKSLHVSHTITRMLWIPLLALVVGVPVVSWALKAPFADSLASSYLMLTLLGQFTGIVGAQLFAFALVFRRITTPDSVRAVDGPSRQRGILTLYAC